MRTMKEFEPRRSLAPRNMKLPEICGVRGCRNRATRWFSLLEDTPCLCSHHSKNPPRGRWAKLVEAANAPPDDFDIPI